MAVYKLNEITKTLDKLFKYNVKTTEKVLQIRIFSRIKCKKELEELNNG